MVRFGENKECYDSAYDFYISKKHTDMGILEQKTHLKDMLDGITSSERGVDVLICLKKIEEKLDSADLRYLTKSDILESCNMQLL